MVKSSLTKLCKYCHEPPEYNPSCRSSVTAHRKRNPTCALPRARRGRPEIHKGAEAKAKAKEASDKQRNGKTTKPYWAGRTTDLDQIDLPRQKGEKCSPYNKLDLQHSQQLLKHLTTKQRESCLEFGSGNGRVTMLLARHYSSVDIVEMHADMLERGY